jgi:hypothetical protein
MLAILFKKHIVFHDTNFNLVYEKPEEFGNVTAIYGFSAFEPDLGFASISAKPFELKLHWSPSEFRSAEFHTESITTVDLQNHELV